MYKIMKKNYRYLNESSGIFLRDLNQKSNSNKYMYL